MTALRKSLAALALTLPFTVLAQAPAAPAEPAAAPPAPPPPPLVQVYGTLNVNLQYTEASDATAGSDADVAARWAVSSDSTNIGFRGGLDLNPALKVVYQCETSAGLDLSAGSLCGRNSRVGLSGDWGTLFYGNWDTPFKAGAYGTKADDPFGNTDVFGYQGIMGTPGYNVRSAAWTGAPTAGFDLRAANSVAYWTPKFAGLSAKVQWGVDEPRSADGVVDPMLLSAAVNYDLAGLSLVGSVDYHEDAYGIRTVSPDQDSDERAAAKDWAWRVSAGYELPLPMGALTVMGMLEQLSYEQKNAAEGYEDYSRLAWLIGAKFRTGNHEFRARYSQALDPDVTTVAPVAAGDPDPEENLGAQHLAFGYAHHLAKSTQVFVFYTQILNDDAAQYTFSIGGAPGMGGGTPAGADPMALGVGIRHAF